MRPTRPGIINDELRAAPSSGIRLSPTGAAEGIFVGQAANVYAPGEKSWGLGIQIADIRRQRSELAAVLAVGFDPTGASRRLP